MSHSGSRLEVESVSNRSRAFTSRVLKGMAVLAGGSGASKLIGLVSLPVITRLYTPGDMGALAVFASLLMLLVPTLTLQYHRALPVPRTDVAAANLLAVCLALILGLSGLLWLGLLAGGDPLLRILSVEVLAPVWWLLPLGTAILSSALSLQLWATRRRAYRIMAGAEVGQSLAGNGAKIGLAFVMAPPFGLVFGHMIAQGGAIVWLLARFWNELGRLRRHVSVSRMRVTARRHRGFPVYRMPSQLILLASSQAPVLFIAAIYGATTAGLFGLAMMALSMPMNLIGRTMGQAFFGEAAHLGRGDPAALRGAVLRVTALLAVIGAGIALMLVLAAPPLFPLVFGPAWAEAGHFAATLSIFLAFQFAAAPVMNVLSVLGREQVYFQLNLIRLALVVGVFGGTVVLELTAGRFVLLFSLVMGLHYLICYARVLRELRLSNRVR